jgi:hypothetical protein
MKYSVALVSILALVSFTAASPIQDLEVEKNFDTQLTGGDKLTASGSFVNRQGVEKPFMATIDVSSEDMNVSGREFSSVQVYLNDQRIVCDLFGGSQQFICADENIDIESGENSFNASLETVTYIKPGSYSVDLELRSTVGVPSKAIEESAAAFKLSEFRVGSSTVTVNSSENATVNLEYYDELDVDAPENAENFLSAVSVKVGEKDEVSSSGTVTFDYSQGKVNQQNIDESSISIYYFDKGEWDKIDSVVDEDQNAVTAEVEHFSTYAAYGEEGSSGGSDSDNEENQQNTNETSENQTENDPGQENEEIDSGSDTSDGSDSEEDGQQSSENQADPGNEGNGQRSDSTQTVKQSQTANTRCK